MVRKCCCSNPEDCPRLQKRLTDLKLLELRGPFFSNFFRAVFEVWNLSTEVEIIVSFYRIGFTIVPKHNSTKSTISATESNKYGKRLVVHPSLPKMDQSKDYYIAYCHWHPKVLELHHKAKQIVLKTMFPRTVSLDMGKESISTNLMECKKLKARR